MEEGASSDQVSSLNLSGSQTVYDGYPGGRAAAAVQQAEAVYRVSQVAYDAAMKSVVYQVKQAYYTLLGDQDTVLLRQATAGQAAENLALYQGLFTAGRATKLDVLQVQVALTQAQLDVRTAQNTVVTDRKKLSLATGWPLEKQYSVADSPLPDLPALGTEEALKAAFQNRSELLTLQQDIGAAEIALLLQKSQSLPVVSLKASVGVGQDWTANTTQGAFTAGVSIALPPIYDGGLQNAQVQQAADQVAAYKVQQAQQGQSITIDVGNALFGVVDARERNALAGLNVQQAQGQYDLEKAKLSAGSGTTLDVLTAFSVLATARVGLAQAKSNYLLAVLNLYNVMGL
jgi:outer membrane protein